ncbi:MAG: 1,4-dihydroxy-6-naphthoate synthase [Bacteroidales bacterium]|nr:1,4-dihydroxy-6-naphthoate synthase [Bacteroidales bacterium]
MNLSLNFSPCPNDTFIFDALVHHRIDSYGLDFTVYMADVEELNQRVLQGMPDISKLSFNAYTKVYKDYVMLDAGAALGKGVGPLLICRPGNSLEKILNKTIAIPGINTTAAFLLNFAFGKSLNIKEMLFSDIENAVLSGEVDAGVIIHENRFTYQDKGLICLADLGLIWEEKTLMPVPLGGIVAKRSLGNEIISQVSQLISSSVIYAWNNPLDAFPFIKQHAQEMEEVVMRKHIALYVNDFSVSLRQEGRRAIQKMFDTYGISTGNLPLVLPESLAQNSYL